MDDGFEKVQAKYDYTAAEGAVQELSMLRGEVLTLLDDSKSWWRVKNKIGKSGYVPSNYIMRTKSTKNKTKIKETSKPTKEPLKIRKSDKSINGKVKYFNDWLKKSQFRKFKKSDEPKAKKDDLICEALYNYDKTRDDELQLYKGQKILILEESEDDWWRGRNLENGQDGWFPSNYVELPPGYAKVYHQGIYQGVSKISSCKMDQKQSTNQDQEQFSEDVLAAYSDNSPVIENVRCLYDFSAKTTEELSFRENDELQILGKVDNDPEWWVGRDRDGRIGLIPRIYTEVMETRQAQPPKNSVTSAPVPSGRYAAMQSKDWFFCQIETRDMAENELRNAIEGDFIVRPSESSRGEGSLSISVKGKLKNKHFKVTRENNQFKIGQRNFNSVDDLISNYIKNPIFSNGDEKLYLVRPLPK